MRYQYLVKVRKPSQHPSRSRANGQKKNRKFNPKENPLQHLRVLRLKYQLLRKAVCGAVQLGLNLSFPDLLKLWLENFIATRSPLE